MARIIFLIIVLYGLYRFGRAILRFLLKAHDSYKAQQDAAPQNRYHEERAWESPAPRDDARRLPSWMGSAQMADFNHSVYQFLRKDGLSEADAKRLLNHRNTYLSALYVAGNMEQKGADYAQQKMAAGQALVALWRRADHSQLFSDPEF